MTGRVSIRGLGHRFGGLPVLDDVDVEVQPGEVAALIGPTGCGKSTILRVLGGLLRPTAGTAEIDGVSVVGTPGRAGYMPQSDTLMPWYRALPNAALGAEVRGVPAAEARRRARALFARFGLAGFEDSWPSQLSGGMRQRVALLRTVLTEAPVMLLDEPFGALDAITRGDLQGWLAELIAETGHTVVLVTHDIDEALRLGDDVLVMSPRPGRIVDRVRVELPRPRPAAALVEPAATRLKARVLASLDPGDATGARPGGQT